MALEAFESQTTDLIVAIRLCQSNGLTIPVLMLLYSAIDGMAWCARRDAERDVTEADFTEWAERYLLPGIDPELLNGVDLYAARCAMLHGQIAESRKSKGARGEGGVVPDCQWPPTGALVRS